MRKFMFATLLSAAGVMVGGVHAADKVTSFTLDPMHTQVQFSWDHFGFSSPGAIFKVVEGEILANETTPEKSSVSVSIQVDSIETGVPLLNEHLLTLPEYFKVKNHPTISFKSSAITNVDRDAEEFDLVGILTVNGISKEVVLDTEVNKIGEHPMWDNARALGLSAETTIKRSDFGMGKYAPAVSDELEVKITLEAIETKGYLKKLESSK
ncbi:YceI family protein [Alcanivorax sp. 1008]|uniref:YceI family protein n=1 Tax=Alcanivorax sp. 1008 TaxID=2816853 RepID=UPI001D41F5B0|nr:YceI family protein [Alcanivorax sp. 1008]MCC1496614.1 YceI family protein [Alcanivorax sp. 1008]